jgi:non-specific serine/threonine protein kinase/serine/threonine-protein kinase
MGHPDRDCLYNEESNKALAMMPAEKHDRADQDRDHRNPVAEGGSLRTMNPDPTRPEPDDDATAAGADSDLVDTIALEAVTAAATPRPEAIPMSPRDAVDDSDNGPAVAVGEADPMVGRRLGAYQLVARIAGGGMGSVYLADRVEGFEQQVAIKLIRRGMDSEAIVRRFRAEIHVQAALGRHPHIAGLLDVGTAEDGRPYFVMEYVDGRRIDEDCDARRLDIPARLRLFAQVCDAVQFAHQHAVIHRDLKPGNILVKADGVPKLIGFGIAKLIDPGADAADGPTRTGELVLTPEYASPEQVTGEPLTTASDVYALGVVLYQLLTGRRPYRLKARTTAEVFQAICEQAPERPSIAVVRRPAKPAAPPESAPAPIGTAGPVSLAPVPAPAPDPVPEEVAAARGTHPAGLKRALAGDLDMIVLMAMRKEPERRYASAERLADDLRRHLDGRPVRARGESTAYRAGKFVRRHAAAVAAAMAVVLALVAGVVGTATGLVLARRGRDRAEASSRQARRAVDQFFTRVSEERLLNQPGLHPLRKELLQDARRFYEGFLAERAGDPALRAELAGARSRLARITAEIGSPAEAADQSRRAIALWDDLLGSHPGNPEYQEELARTLNERATVLLRLKDRRDEALGACRRALKVVEAALAGDPASVPRRHLLGQVLENTAQIQFEQGHPREAIETLGRVLEIEGQLAAEDPRSVAPRIVMAKAHGLLGQILVEQPDGSGPALASCQQAVEILEAINREHPELADQSYTLALELSDLSTVQQRAGKLDSALKSSRRAIEVLEQLDRQYPGVLNYRGGLAGAYNLISDLHRRRLEPAESLAFAEKARPLLEQLAAEHPEDIYARVDLSKSYSNIGRMRQHSGEPAEALRSFQRAVDLLEGLPELDARNSYHLACNLSLCIPLIGAKEGSQGVHDPDALTKDDRLRRQLYGDRAIEVLRRAVRGGFVNTEILQSDPDLAAIRARDDFQQIVKDVEKPATADRK